MTEEASTSPWWSIPQAIIWIVTRSDPQVLRVNGLRMIANVQRMSGIRPGASLQDPPLSLAAAPDELVQAWQARRISLYGRKWGRQPSRLIPTRISLRLRDHRGEACLGENTLYFDTCPFWSDLWVQAEDCKRCWPGLGEHAAASRPVPAARPTSDRDVLEFIEEKRNALRAERKRAGRDVLLRAAINQFGLSRKVALDIWNSAPRDRKGGRPKKAKPGGLASRSSKE
jgi:hypothetical protein